METIEPVKSFFLTEPYPTTTTSSKVAESSSNLMERLACPLTGTSLVVKPI